MHHRSHAIPFAIVALAALGPLAAACGHDSSTPHRSTMPSAVGHQTGAMPGGMGGGMGGQSGGSMMVAGEFDYLTRMIPHHEEAIAAARILQNGTRRTEMRAFAASIIATQSAEAEQMKAWLAAWYPGHDTRVDYAAMMRDLQGLTGDALDRAFLEDMIPHHMMAVMMSQQLMVTRGSVQPDVIPFASNIRDTQQAEIAMMNAWLRQWFGSRR